MVVDEGPFAELEKQLLLGLHTMVPSRSPSPFRASKAEGGGYIEDDVNLEEMMQTMTEEQIKALTEKHQTK